MNNQNIQIFWCLIIKTFIFAIRVYFCIFGCYYCCTKKSICLSANSNTDAMTSHAYIFLSLTYSMTSHVAFSYLWSHNVSFSNFWRHMPLSYLWRHMYLLHMTSYVSFSSLSRHTSHLPIRRQARSLTFDVTCFFLLPITSHVSYLWRHMSLYPMT